MALLVASATFGVGLAIVPVAPSPASADRGDITTYTDAEGEIDQPTDIAVAADGIVWFTSQANDRIGRLDPGTGEISVFEGDPGEIDGPNHLTIGADGNVWFTNVGNDLIGRLDVDSGVVDSFADPGGDIHDPGGIATGPDGNVWVTGGARIGRITPAGVMTTYPLGSLFADSVITAGDDGRLWFLAKQFPNLTTQGIAFIETANGLATYVRSQSTVDLIDGPDGRLWYPRLTYDSDYPLVYMGTSRIDPVTGSVDSLGIYDTYNGLNPPTGPRWTRLLRGPDHSVWYLNGGPTHAFTGASVGRINAVTGAVQRWADPSGVVQTGMEMATAPDGGVWYTVPALDLIRRVDGAGPEVTVGKTVDESQVHLGEDIHYDVTVTNTGTETLTGLMVTDDNAPRCAGPIDDLDPAEAVTVSCTLTTGWAQWRTYANVATVDTDQLDPVASNQVSTYVQANPSLSVTLSAGEPGVVAGEAIHYRLTVRNSGDVPLTNVSTTDEAAPDCARALGDLAVGAQVVVDCERATTYDDLGVVTNRATALADHAEAKNSNAVSVSVGTDRLMSVDTSALETTVEAGQPIHLVTGVSNDGNVPLAHVSVSYAGIPACTSDLGTIPVAGGETADCTYQTVPADVGTFTAAGTASADHLGPVTADPVSVEVTIPPAGYTDVAPAAFYAGAVDWAALFDVVPGVTETTFRPSKTVNRARLVDALFRMMDQPPGSPRHPFDDVPRNAWFRRAVDWAVAQGLVSGARANFRPGDAVSRADVVKLTWLMVGAPTGNPAHGFTDVPAGARYNAALKWAASHDLLDGFVSGTRFKPDRVVSRGQLADVMFRLASTEAAWPQGPGDPAPPSTVLF